jgi:hypothetical protein
MRPTKQETGNNPRFTANSIKLENSNLNFLKTKDSGNTDLANHDHLHLNEEKFLLVNDRNSRTQSKRKMLPPIIIMPQQSVPENTISVENIR